MRDNRVILKLVGVIMAISGAVLIIHTVPVFAWYMILLLLVLIFVFVMFNA